ncbi:MAG TPA: response regulator [Thermomicrobiales bacterium]|jgi:DNA-binding response OmpR family regulator|nr:response regulator [Thermomicrobiales bacterium]
MVSVTQPVQRKRHILAINSSSDVLAMISSFLSEEGYRVTTHLFRDRVIPLAGDLAPDLIILDYQGASDDDGWSTLQMLRLAPGTATIPIVLCTGAISHVEETRDHLRDLGIEVLYKPFRLDSLLDLIMTTLATSVVRKSSNA